MGDVIDDKECPVCCEGFTYKIEGGKNNRQTARAYCCGKLICLSCWEAMDAASTTGEPAPCPYCRAPRPTAEQGRVLLLDHAEKGKKAWAQSKLGENYHMGEGGFPVSYERAFRWYQMAANQGFSDAQYNLGSMYFKGVGVAKSYKKAFEFFSPVAEVYSHASFLLGIMHYDGEGTPQSYPKAFERFTSASKAGHVQATFQVGFMNLYGKGVPQSYKNAVAPYTFAANQGYEEAIAELPSILLTLVDEGRIDLRCEAVYRMKIALKLPPSKLPEEDRSVYTFSMEEVTITCGACWRMKKEDEPNLSRCNGCQCIYYCNRECQKAHWKAHKPTCQEIASRQNAL
jgi:TPR repeat protein